jgi:uroporphyrinogen-III synthase
VKSKNLKRILVTRSLEGQSTLCQALSEVGISTISLPLIKIVPTPIEKPECSPILVENIRNLNQYDALIFISPTAAKIGFKWVEKYCSIIPSVSKILAIGPSTARIVESLFGYLVEKPGVGMTSEDLLDTPYLSDVGGKNIGIFRGVAGRHFLRDELVSRGGVVDYLEVYRREKRRITTEELAPIFSKKVDGIICLSGEVAELLSSFPSNFAMREVPLYVPSIRLVRVAVDLGFTKVVNTNGAETENILASLVNL